MEETSVVWKRSRRSNLRAIGALCARVCRENGRARVSPGQLQSDVSAAVGGIRRFRPTWTRFQVGWLCRSATIRGQTIGIRRHIVRRGRRPKRKGVKKTKRPRIKQHENPTDETLSLFFLSLFLTSRATAKHISIHVWNVPPWPCTRVSHTQHSRCRNRSGRRRRPKTWRSADFFQTAAVLGRIFNASNRGQLSAYLFPPAALHNRYLVYAYTLSYRSQHFFWLVSSHRFPSLFLFYPSCWMSHCCFFSQHVLNYLKSRTSLVHHYQCAYFFVFFRTIWKKCTW